MDCNVKVLFAVAVMAVAMLTGCSDGGGSDGGQNAGNDNSGNIVVIFPDPIKPSDRNAPMLASNIIDYDKYNNPDAAKKMLYSKEKWSWWRMKQSNHFFVFWEAAFGDNPASSSVPKARRVNVDDLLLRAEKIYDTNVNVFGMAVVGRGKSQLDKYKIKIYLNYGTADNSWTAQANIDGDGWPPNDRGIGKLDVTPLPARTGQTVAHETGHTFQYIVHSDVWHHYNAELVGGGLGQGGFGYDYYEGSGAIGGLLSIYEQSANFQSFHEYPQDAFTVNDQEHFKDYCHYHFNYEDNRYRSYWFLFRLTQKYGNKALGRLWRESRKPDDPLMAFKKLFCADNLDAMWDEYYEYVKRMADYDFDAIHSYRTQAALDFKTAMTKDNGGYTVSDNQCPHTSGFNLIPLKDYTTGQEVTAQLSSTAAGAGYRFGFVAVTYSGDWKNSQSHYGAMQRGGNGTAKMTVPANTKRLFLCVAAAPAAYKQQEAYYKKGKTDSDKWPYTVKFTGADYKG